MQVCNAGDGASRTKEIRLREMIMEPIMEPDHLLIRHGELFIPFGLSLSKPIHLSTGSRRTNFKHDLAVSINHA